jgi:hypothetical protein
VARWPMSLRVVMSLTEDDVTAVIDETPDHVRRVHQRALPKCARRWSGSYAVNNWLSETPDQRGCGSFLRDSAALGCREVDSRR